MLGILHHRGKRLYLVLHPPVSARPSLTAFCRKRQM